MSTLVSVRALLRTPPIRIGSTRLSTTADTVIDLDIPKNRVDLHHFHDQIVASITTTGGLRSDTTTTQTIQSSLTFAAEKRITLTSNANTGSVSRLIEFHATNIIDRPWASWFDQNNRHVVAIGAHDTLPVSEGATQLKQFEIKTVADALGNNPTELRTRFAVQYDVQRGTWGVNFVDNFEINQGENPILTTPGTITPFGLRLRGAAQDTFTSSNFVAAQFTVELDASDNVIGFIDVNVPYRSGGTSFPGNKTATLDFFRNTNTSSASSPQIAVKLGDGTNSNALLFTAKSGLFELPLALSGTTGIKLGADATATLYRSASGIIKTDAGLMVVGNVGFNNTSPAAKPTVSGSRSANAALASLLTALAGTGLLTDGTTV